MATDAQTCTERPVSTWPGLSGRLDVETTKKKYYAEGYVRADAFVTESELNQMRREVKRYIDDVIPNIPTKAAFYNEHARAVRLEKMMDNDEFFKELAESPFLNGIANLLVDTECFPFNVQYFDHSPGRGGIPPHQDCRHFMHNQAVTFWLALTDSDSETGCLSYVPSSNLRGELEHRPFEIGCFVTLAKYEDWMDHEVEMSVKAGTLLGHHPYTIHRSGENKSKDRSSQTLALTYWAKNIINNK